MNQSRKYEWNSFSGKIIVMILTAIILISITVTYVVLSMSQNVFMENYGKSQEQIFNQIQKEMNNLHMELQDIADAVDSSWAFRIYLDSDDVLDNVQNFQNIYQMQKDLEQSKASNMDRANVLVMGTKGRHYLSRTETISMDDQEILDSEPVQIAIAEPEVMHYTYASSAYTATTQQSNVLIASKALYYRESKEVYAIVLITLTMDELGEYFNYFNTDTTDWYMVDSQDVVICSNQGSSIGKVMTPEWYEQARDSKKSRYGVQSGGRYLTVMKKELNYYDCNIYGVVDNKLAINELYNMPLLTGICAGIGGVIMVICLCIANKIIGPLSRLVQNMSTSRHNEFKQKVPVSGPIEVQELAETYNVMLEDIQNYIAELLKIQKEKRKAEIKALQMQINPHYIYNTLASIKMLVYQREEGKACQAIDAFISLLRNTISNTAEFITILQELENIENYILINQIRYGDAIRVEYYVSSQCYDCLIPKMVLQPFIENAFFHGFPSGRNGTIQIFMKVIDDVLDIRISDDGIGMDQDTAQENIMKKKEHFSGIGIHNVQERLKLLYGSNYGVEVESRKNRGTTVIVRLPAQKKEQAGTEKEDGGEIQAAGFRENGKKSEEEADAKAGR